MVLEFEQSGLTRRAFCSQRGIAPGTLDNYRKRRRGAEGDSRTARQAGSGIGSQPANRILPVEFVSGAQRGAKAGDVRGALWVELAGGRRIEVTDGFDGPTLERLIAILEQA